MNHVFEEETELSQPLERVFAFFSDAANLERITPPELRFKILTPQPIVLEAGARIDYQLRLFGVPFKWATLISVWEPPHRFVDDQLSGPYAQWTHTHSFESTPTGARMRDHVLWRLPFSPLGDVAYPLVSRQIRRIFAYRREVMRGLLKVSS